jgi:hypothetical protein
MPFHRLKLPASNLNGGTGTFPAETLAIEEEEVDPTMVESWREEVIAARGGEVSRRRR